MKKKKMYFLGIFICLFIFYWFVLRPSIIRSSCHRWAKENILIISPGELEDGIYGKEYKLNYEACLHSKGLK